MVEEVRELKAQPGKNIYVDGSSELVHALAEHDLVDEYSLLVYPISLGGGKKVFPDGTRVDLELVESSGAAHGRRVHALPGRAGGSLRGYLRPPAWSAELRLHLPSGARREVSVMGAYGHFARLGRCCSPGASGTTTRCRDFRWPELDRFNWALDWFDALRARQRRSRRSGSCGDGAAMPAARSPSCRRGRNRVANWLRALGVRRGDRVLLMLPNVVAAVGDDARAR